MLLGPLAATFPLSLIPPFAIGAVAMGFPWAAIGGALLGLFFAGIPNHYYEEFASERWLEGSLHFASVGAGFGLAANLTVELLQKNSFSFLTQNGWWLLFAFAAYAGAATAFVIWPLARWIRGTGYVVNSNALRNGL